MVEGRLWGVVIVTAGEPLPLDTGERLEKFTELVATAIANAEAREELQRLADEQAALRRVATLVANEAPREEVFNAIAEGIGTLLEAEEIRMLRYEGGDSVVEEAGWGRNPSLLTLGVRHSLKGDGVTARVLRTGKPARMDDFDGAPGEMAAIARANRLRSAVGIPILVDGRVWGAMVAGALEPDMLPLDTDARLGQFTELMATAIANTESRARADRLAAEQAALRRVATLVAREADPEAVFGAVADEVGSLLGCDSSAMVRFEPDGTVTVLGGRHPPGRRTIDERVAPAPDSVIAAVRRSGAAVRFAADDPSAEGTSAPLITQRSRCRLATPIVVRGDLWGALTASCERALERDAEGRLADFADLVATAIANGDSRDQLTASRARVLTAADEARRRVARDLHDGAQQRLVHTILVLKLIQGALRNSEEDTDALVAEALAHAEQGNRELRELAHGILPEALTQGGLRAGVDAIARRLDLPVRLDIPAERLPRAIEASAYFVVAEALTNVMKHSRAARAEVTVSVRDGMLDVEVLDDGIGGADPAGHGMLGIKDRVEVLGGRFETASPPGGGTRVSAALPL